MPHKIFLGMAAGVGKTYRMLQEGQAEAEAGRDVVVGLVETHGREETAALLEGLEVIPRRPVPYRGTRLEVADHDVAPRLELRVPLLQHPVRLADAGGHAQEDLVMAPHAPRRLWTTRSISLMPTNGAIRPPTPYRSRLRRSSAVAPTGR